MIKRHSVRVFPVEEVTTIASTEVPAQDVGLRTKDVERIWKACVSYYKTGAQPAMALCIRHRGQVILDRAIGHAWGNGPGDPPDTPKRLATPDTLYNLFSGSKPFVAMLVHKLAEDGRLHLDDYVAQYVPEFQTPSKEKITIRHLLEHKAGIPTTGGNLDLDLLTDPKKIRAQYHETEAWYRPGRRVAYHAISAGFVLADIIEERTGKDINTYMQEVVCDPLGISLRWGVTPENLENLARDRYTGWSQIPPINHAFRRAFGATMEELIELTRDERFLTGVVPSGNCMATPNDACAFFELLLRGGTLNGTEIFARETVRSAVREANFGEFDGVLGAPIRYGAGFMLGAKVLSIYGLRTSKVFGHLGLSNVLIWADPERDISVCLMTTGKPVITPEALRWIIIPQIISRRIPRIYPGRTI